ncbi:MAG: 2-isopropylmalate synthase, partial [Boseongicola sp.]|nr:2-isopropylmalate synthase [Boseongicola sp.]
MKLALGLILPLAAAGPGGALAQEVVTKQYDDGGVYEGTFKDGQQHGQGTYRLPNGYVYEGEWVEGKIEGQGKASY